MPISTLDASPSPADAGLDLRTFFRGAAASTWVVTGTGPNGPVGFTAISITSVSLDPPLVSFNISKESNSLGPIARSRRAALHLLNGEQRALAERFARDRTLRFIDDGVWSLDPHGLPVLHDVAARMVVDIVNLVDAGDSFIAVAAVRGAHAGTPAPLIHHAGDYHPVTTVTTTSTTTIGA
ncbi:MAG TPA: flavin reductase family protein [Intrasporangiaceae bacterium]|nr:flavin reductase family protein [Intrasporangiaceae bacterium]